MPDRPSGSAPHHRARPRPAPVDREPSSRVGLALILLDEVTRTADRLRPVLQAVEQVTGLQPAQVQTLLTFGQEAPVAPTGAAGREATDRPKDWSTDLMISDLVARGLLQAGPATEGMPARHGLRLTDRGIAVLAQVQGVQIRILDTVVGALGDRRVAELRESLHAVGAVLDDMAAHTGERH